VHVSTTVFVRDVSQPPRLCIVSSACHNLWLNDQCIPDPKNDLQSNRHHWILLLVGPKIEGASQPISLFCGNPPRVALPHLGMGNRKYLMRSSQFAVEWSVRMQATGCLAASLLRETSTTFQSNIVRSRQYTSTSAADSGSSGSPEPTVAWQTLLAARRGHPRAERLAPW
jgi:hypothetical protein